MEPFKRKRYRVAVLDDTGRDPHYSDVFEWNEGEYQNNLKTVAMTFARDIPTFYVQINGNLHYFNRDKLISVWIEEIRSHDV